MGWGGPTINLKNMNLGISILAKLVLDESNWPDDGGLPFNMPTSTSEAELNSFKQMIFNHG